MLSSLQSFLEESERPFELLNSDVELFHTTTGENFRDIIMKGVIFPSLCTVFEKERLVYFFAGRPGYKTSLIRDPAHWHLPAIIAFEPFSSIDPKRIFPFDSGAASSSRFYEVLGIKNIYNYELKPNIRTFSKLINFFFGDYDSYKDGKPISFEKVQKIIGNNTLDIEILSLSRLYNYRFNEQIDDRARLIEFQYDREIDLKLKNPKFIICCDEWMRDSRFKEKIGEFNCDIRTFSLLPLNTDNYYSKIYELCRL
jgi:hypothetical protein